MKQWGLQYRQSPWRIDRRVQPAPGFAKPHWTLNLFVPDDITDAWYSLIVRLSHAELVWTGYEYRLRNTRTREIIGLRRLMRLGVFP